MSHILKSSQITSGCMWSNHSCPL